MVRKEFFHQTKQYRKLVIGSILPLAFVFLLVQVIAAQQIVTAAQLEVTKTVDREIARHGDTVQYSISMDNIGDQAASGAVMTDTVPSDLTLDEASVSIIGGYDSWGVDGNVITWTGGIVGNGGTVEVSFDAVVSDTAAFDPITNTVYVTGTGSLLSDEVVFTVTEQITTYVFFPILLKAPPIPALLSVSAPTTSDKYDNFQFVANWSDVGVGQYELQESNTPDFANATLYNAGDAQSTAVNHTISPNYEFYYRVRFIDNGLYSDWSNTIKQYGPYIDHFNDPNSGWKIRREDLDDADNTSYYQNSNFVLKIKGRWDYAIGSPMKIVPWDSYKIETRVRFDPGVDNLHSYGLIWGGDWDGSSECPNKGFTSCLNHYYRLNVLWYGSPGSLRTQIKRIDYHDSSGAGRGDSLAGYADNGVGSPSGDWKVWSIEQHINGTIRLAINGNVFRTTYGDTTYTGAGTYFGVLATSNEYSGAEPWYDWVKVTPLP